jgi:hypothetical protein
VDSELRQLVDSDRLHQPIHSVNNPLPRLSAQSQQEECLELPQLPILVSDNRQVDSVNLVLEEECLVKPNNNPHRPDSVSPLRQEDYSVNLLKHPLLVEGYLETPRLDLALNQLNPLLPIPSGLLELLNPLLPVSELPPLEDSDQALLPTLSDRPPPLELERHSVDSELLRTNSKRLLLVACLVAVVDLGRTTNNNSPLLLLVDSLDSRLNNLLNRLLEDCLGLLLLNLVGCLEELPQLLPLALLPDSVSPSTGYWECNAKDRLWSKQRPTTRSNRWSLR